VKFGTLRILNDKTPFCVTITNGVTEGSSTKLLTTQYTDCYDCLSNNYGTVTVTDCIGTRYLLTLESFGFLPTIGATYYLTFLLTNPKGGSNLITTCVTVNKDGIRQISENEYTQFITDGKIGVIQIGPTLETNCQDCLSGNSLSYEVARCTDDTTDYVLLINDSFIDHIIAYSDGVNEYCGTVVGLGTGAVPFTFINDYGLGGDGGDATCDQCLATENQKILIQSCTNEEYTEVVWASTLYGGGEVSNLSTDDGCFEVIGLTEDPVTIDSFLNFDPQPGCEPCIECNGIVYSYETCYGVSGFTDQGFIGFGSENEQPLAVGYNPDTQHMYVTTQSTRMIIIDPGTNTESSRNSIPNIQAQDILYYDTDLMYLTNSTGSGGIIGYDTSLGVIGTTTAYSLSGTYSYQLDGDLPNNRLFITCSDYSVKIFDTNTNTVTSSISTASGYYEKFLAYHPINDTVYTTASGYYSVEVYDVSTLAHVQSIGLIDGAYDIAYEPNSGNMYVTCSGYYNVKVIDTNTNTVIKTINTIENPGKIRYNSTDGYMYVTTDSGLLTINPLTDIIVVQTTGLGGIMGFYGFDFYDLNNRPYVNTNNYAGDDGLRYFELQNIGTQSGYIESYQYLPSESVFYNPAINLCCNITGTASGYVGDDKLYSVVTFTGNDDDCAECLINGQPNIQIWNASACTASNTYSSFYVTTDLTAVQGDVVKLMWGSNEWICAQLLNTASSYSGYYTYYNTQNNGSGETLIYDSCENCNSQGLIGVTLVNCDTLVESFVSITLDNYLSIYNFGSLTNYSVKDSDGSCYQITNLCPIPLEEQEFTAVEFYFNCTFCEPFEPNAPRSANTESNLCQEVCTSGGTTTISIEPPHPVWTDGYGTPVTQLNMITLGGPNGLNN
jgi:DNA-binding beta-propeller fold protein YncE